MLLYNTLTRKKDSFVPKKPGRAGIYACGITAYDYCHIGHARSAIVFDILSRYLRYTGLDVTFVRNFTDVDDKIITRANKEGTSSEEVATKYIAAFHEDMDALGVIRADVEPKATDHIDGMIAICQTLIAGGHAYATPSGDVYFRVRSFDQYGKLSGRSIDDLLSGARIAPGEEKEDPLDFALWKAAKPGEPFWESPYGKGRPGWHIECSAMSEKFLDLPFDIHGGGQDLVFPHHENEIAQTEASTGKQMAEFWVHNGFVQINAEKMAKSLGNFKTIRDILAITPPEVLRFFLLTRHYRSPIDYSTDALEEVETNVKRLYETLAILDLMLAKGPGSGGPTAEAEQLEQECAEHCQGFADAMEDDLNTAAALGHVNALFRLVHRVAESKQLRKSAKAFAVLQTVSNQRAIISKVLGLFGQDPETFLATLKTMRVQRKNIDETIIQSLLKEREQARSAKDFASADKLRDQLAQIGVGVRDTPEGQVWDVL